MSWLNPQKQFLNIMCKVTPSRSICRSHFMEVYPECFQSGKGYIARVLELPQKLWDRLVNDAETIQHLKGQHSSCPMFDEDNEVSQVVATIFKVMFVFAVSVGIFYAMLKVISQRRAIP